MNKKTNKNLEEEAMVYTYGFNFKGIDSLEEFGFKKEWIEEVKKDWNRKNDGKYGMMITLLRDAASDPEDEIIFEATKFSNNEELNEIHKFFEGFGYIMYDLKTRNLIGKGIIDGAPFEEMAEYTNEDSWYWNLEEY